jgi:Phosphotransferase enzyme family
MSVRRVDSRFLLPRWPKAALVLGDLQSWRAALLQVGVDVIDGSGRRPDLVVAPATLHRQAESLAPEMLILEGRAVRPTAYESRRFLARPGLEQPSLFVPLDAPIPARYAIERWSVIDTRWKRIRAATAAALVERRRFPRLGSTVTVATRTSAAPHILAAAEPFGVPREARWALTLGQGDVLSRNVFHVFPADGDEPEWVIKFARIPGYSDPFDRDERGLALAAAAAGRVAEHAPRLIGRFQEHGLHASIETAGKGRRLREHLLEPGPHSSKLRLVEKVAEWIIELGRETAGPNEALSEELARLDREVVTHWTGNGARSDLAQSLPSLNPVLQHNDLGSWNIVVNERSFTVLDWESARKAGLPLWDLFYFLADALAVLDGNVRGEQRHLHTIRLFRGELPSSRTLFAWTRRAVKANSVLPQAVGVIAMLCWLHHSLSHVHRSAAMGRFATDAPPTIHGTEGVADLWLSDPLLGERWMQWLKDD